MEWLVEHFPGYEVPASVVEAAAKAGHLCVLQFLYDKCAHETSFLPSGRDEPPPYNNLVEWRKKALTSASWNDHFEVVRWLVEIGFPFNENSLLEDAEEGVNADLLEWLLEHGRAHEENVTTGILKAFLLRVLASGELDWALVAAARLGRVDLLGEIVGRLPQEYIDTDEAFGEPLMMAGKNGQLNAVRWMVDNGYAENSECGVARGFMDAVAHGHLEVARFLQSRYGIDDDNVDPGVILFSAAAYGHLHALQWLYENFADFRVPISDMLPWDSDSKLFDLVNDEADATPTTPMDAAAMFGHLEVVQFLHSVSATASRGVTRSASVVATTNAMDGAAALGHLEVVKWLHGNRSEG